ncbi:hypothetical protein RF11_02043 [Thelohanellus kitauei]|uniref:Uncharacterized protein n=1 Tax=Thelohanellus kitauei TaxID=669202 RepID=A0A0C2MXP3_THEKT|nr:hypothetical protein RF11_02043 [Thelohanellus kitauei]
MYVPSIRSPTRLAPVKCNKVYKPVPVHFCTDLRRPRMRRCPRTCRAVLRIGTLLHAVRVVQDSHLLKIHSRPLPTRATTPLRHSFATKYYKEEYPTTMCIMEIFGKNRNIKVNSSSIDHKSYHYTTFGSRNYYSIEPTEKFKKNSRELPKDEDSDYDYIDPMSLPNINSRRNRYGGIFDQPT